MREQLIAWQNDIWERVHITDGCWNWVGYAQRGYGVFEKRIAGIRYRGRAHRVVYELLVGPIPEGLTIDHLCRNTLCVNPDHLEPVTGAENVRRANAFRTHCIRGHEFTEENTYYRNGGRRCRPCFLAYQREWRRARAA